MRIALTLDQGQALRVLAGRASSYQDVAEATGLSHGAARAAVRLLVRKGLATRVLLDYSLCDITDLGRVVLTATSEPA